MYKTILHPTDLTKNHFNLAQQAVRLAQTFDAEIYFIHVIEPPVSLQLAQGLGFAEFDKPMREDAETVMSTLTDALNIPQTHQFIEIGSIKVHVLEKARELMCDLIVVGSHSPSKLPSFLGSTAHAVIHHAECDVLTVRTNLAHTPE